MQENTKNLIQKMLDDFLPVAEDLAAHGKDHDDIVKIFQLHIKSKQQNYYGRPENIKVAIDKIFESLPQGESKAEWIFCDILNKAEIDYQYQYPIGPYKADFLFAGYLVVELDGPQHGKVKDEKRDRYLEKMGYKTLRIPLDVLFHSPQRIKEEILGKIGDQR